MTSHFRAITTTFERLAVPIRVPDIRGYPAVCRDLSTALESGHLSSPPRVASDAIAGLILSAATCRRAFNHEVVVAVSPGLAKPTLGHAMIERSNPNGVAAIGRLGFGGIVGFCVKSRPAHSTPPGRARPDVPDL